MNVKLYKASTNGEFKQKLKQESNNFSTKLAIVFASVQYDFKEALQELKENNINFCFQTFRVKLFQISA